MYLGRVQEALGDEEKYSEEYRRSGVELVSQITNLVRVENQVNIQIQDYVEEYNSFYLQNHIIFGDENIIEEMLLKCQEFIKQLKGFLKESHLKAVEVLNQLKTSKLFEERMAHTFANLFILL